MSVRGLVGVLPAGINESTLVVRTIAASVSRRRTVRKKRRKAKTKTKRRATTTRRRRRAPTGRLKKGSPAAKRRMAQLRKMRRTK
jgi:hypothetical protein